MDIPKQLACPLASLTVSEKMPVAIDIKKKR